MDSLRAAFHLYDLLVCLLGFCDLLGMILALMDDHLAILFFIFLFNLFQGLDGCELRGLLLASFWLVFDSLILFHQGLES